MHDVFDLAIVGGGLVGLSLAAALQRTGLRLALVEPHPERPVPGDDSWDSRVYAISPGSVQFLDTLGAWGHLPPERVTRVETMQVFGDDASSRIEFSAYDAGIAELACIVENRLLQRELWRVVDPSVVIRVPARCVSLEIGSARATLALTDGNTVAARLVVAADGADSWVRERAHV